LTYSLCFDGTNIFSRQVERISENCIYQDQKMTERQRR
jgi:hypothetical protein